MDMMINNHVPPQGNATSSDVVVNKTFTSSGSFVKKTGTIPNQSGTSTLASWANSSSDTQVEITIPQGYYPGSEANIKINDNNLVASNIMASTQIFGIQGSATSDADAIASDIRSGKTAYVGGVKITGTATIT